MIKQSVLALAFAASISFAGGAALASGDHEDHAHEEHGHDEVHHVAELDGLRSVHAWTRAAHKGEDALVFVELQNHSDTPAFFKGGEFDHAASVDLVGFTLKDGNDVYVSIPEMPLKPGQELHLEPKGLALRLNAIEEDFHKGESFEMHLVFARGEMEVDVLIEAEDAKQHSHAGHMHE